MESPITAPPLKPTLRASAILPLIAAAVVRTLAFVAIFMPTNPASAEEKAPKTKEAVIRMSYWNDSSKPTTVTNNAMRMYCSRR